MKIGYLEILPRGHAAPGIKKKNISGWFIPTIYVACESESWQQKRETNFLKILPSTNASSATSQSGRGKMKNRKKNSCQKEISY
jgi:hypothetical protein